MPCDVNKESMGLRVPKSRWGKARECKSKQLTLPPPLRRVSVLLPKFQKHISQKKY